MNKHLKRLLMGICICFCLFIFTGCTKSFSTTADTAVLYGKYVYGTTNEQTQERENSNFDSIISGIKNNGGIAPSQEYWTFIQDKVDAEYTNFIKVDYNKESFKYIPEAYHESHLAYLALTDKSNVDNLVNTSTIKDIIMFSGNEGELWYNFDSWNDEYLKQNPTTAPTTYFLNSFKSTISSGVGSTSTGLTPVSGYYNGVYVEGKTWGQAFSEYGFLEGLLVYPIGWLIYTFSTAFGTTGGGQILAIFLVTLICRSIIVVLSIGSYSTQMKMADLQPQLQLLQAKYPNSQSDPYQKQQMATEQMKLYKKYKVHPFRQLLVLIVQFPLFICVWSALQGSAILTQGSFFGLYLSSKVGTAITAGGSETPTALILLIIMSIAQFFATLLPQWMQNYHKSKVVGDKTVKVEENPSMSVMKYMPYIMLVMIIFMSIQLPAAMLIYWFFGALISIFQTIITELIKAISKRKRKNKNYTSYKKVKEKKSKTMKLK